MLELFGNGADRVLIFGGIHGDEPTSAELARKFADHLRINWDLFEGKTIGILAEANPDGLIRKTRTNANGIDLNRNFPARNWSKAARRGAAHGPRPASEPETRAILKAMEIIQPARIVSIHSATAGHHCNNYDGPARLLAEAMGGHNRYPVKATMGYPNAGQLRKPGGRRSVDPHDYPRASACRQRPTCLARQRQSAVCVYRRRSAGRTLNHSPPHHAAMRFPSRVPFSAARKSGRTRPARPAFMGQSYPPEK